MLTTSLPQRARTERGRHVPTRQARIPREALEISLLGPISVTVAGVPIALDRRQARVLLAALAAVPGAAVSADRLIEALWGDAPPASATGTLHAVVSRLRAALGDRHRSADDAVVQRAGDGYRLTLDSEQVDAARFEQLVRRARTEPDAAAADSYDAALALWSGDALGEAATSAVLQPVAARLEALRLVALEERAEVALRLGRTAAVLPHLEQLVADHPFHERFSALLMTALYRSGRQADALRVFTRTRQVLADELGLQPSPELLTLETAVLLQDPELAAPGRR